SIMVAGLISKLLDGTEIEIIGIDDGITVVAPAVFGAAECLEVRGLPTPVEDLAPQGIGRIILLAERVSAAREFAGAEVGVADQNVLIFVDGKRWIRAEDLARRIVNSSKLLDAEIRAGS